MSLINRIATRNRNAIRETRKVISDYSYIFDEVFKDMCGDEMVAEWLNLDFHRNTSALIDIIGAAKYRVGSVMNVEGGDVVYIDESNVDNYITHMRMILPVALVDDVDVDGLTEFVKEYSRMVLASSQDEMDTMVADNAFLEKYFKCFKNGVKKSTEATPKKEETIEKPQKRIEYEGFDLTDMGLDDAQVAQLLMLQLKGQS